MRTIIQWCKYENFKKCTHEYQPLLNPILPVSIDLNLASLTFLITKTQCRQIMTYFHSQQQIVVSNKKTSQPYPPPRNWQYQTIFATTDNFRPFWPPSPPRCSHSEATSALAQHLQHSTSRNDFCLCLLLHLVFRSRLLLVPAFRSSLCWQSAIM